MYIYYATTNNGKIHSLQREFEPLGVKVLQLSLELREPRTDDVVEIAMGKAEEAYQIKQEPVVAHDAGFYIASLNGFPRAYVNFALQTIGLEGIVTLVSEKDRSCEFRQCLAYLDKNLAEPEIFIGKVPGQISEKERGEIQDHHWSELSRIFIPEGSDKTLAEMTYEEYMDWRKISREKDSPARHFRDWYWTNYCS